MCGKINNSQKKKIAASIVLFAYVWEFVSVRARCACVCARCRCFCTKLSFSITDKRAARPKTKQ